ncbi:MAG: complex I NDUFA9 subunit family protein [Sphingomicrobium sp.]
MIQRPETRPETHVTVFGGSGFIGRYVCEYLLKAGVRLRVASRNPRDAYFLQPLAAVGQLGRVHANITDRNSVADAVKGADCVVNLCGAFRNMQPVHVDGARIVAEEAQAAGASALVQVSAIGADPAADSAYGRTKGEGEAAVRSAFAGATIIRPSLVFGAEDALTNRFAALGRFPVVPVLAPETKFQPVFVRDLAQAIAAAALDPLAHGGRKYEIGGPQVLSMLGLHRAIFAVTGQAPSLVELPDIAGRALSALGFLPGAPLTRDQWAMLQHDNVAAPGAPGLAAFGIEPTPLGAVASEWLGRFRSVKAAGRRPNRGAVA